jgi:hypothetical protein
MNDDFVLFPEVRRRLCVCDNRALKAICKRHNVRWFELNQRVLALRRADLDLLLARACREAA